VSKPAGIDRYDVTIVTVTGLTVSDHVIVNLKNSRENTHAAFLKGQRFHQEVLRSATRKGFLMQPHTLSLLGTTEKRVEISPYGLKYHSSNLTEFPSQ